MPIYEYKCPECGHVFEEWGKASESHKMEKCPECETPAPRIMSRTSFVLKGDGWYVSDYGYRKGITEEGSAPEKSPVKSSPSAPAKQSDKTLAKKNKNTQVAKKEKPAAKKSASEKSGSTAASSSS